MQEWTFANWIASASRLHHRIESMPLTISNSLSQTEKRQNFQIWTQFSSFIDLFSSIEMCNQLVVINFKRNEFCILELNPPFTLEICMGFMKKKINKQKIEWHKRTVFNMLLLDLLHFVIISNLPITDIMDITYRQ